MRLKMILLGVVSTLTLMACVPTTAGSSTLAPFVVQEGSEVLVLDGQTSFIQDSSAESTDRSLADISDDVIAPFTYDEITNGATKQAVLNVGRFSLDDRGKAPEWGLKLESVIVARKIFGVSEVNSRKNYRVSTVLNAIFSLTPPKGSMGKLKAFKFNLKDSNSSVSAVVKFDVRVK